MSLRSGFRPEGGRAGLVLAAAAGGAVGFAGAAGLTVPKRPTDITRSPLRRLNMHSLFIMTADKPFPHAGRSLGVLPAGPGSRRTTPFCGQPPPSDFQDDDHVEFNAPVSASGMGRLPT